MLTKVSIQEGSHLWNRLEAASPNKPRRQPWVLTLVRTSGERLVPPVEKIELNANSSVRGVCCLV